MIPMEGIDGRTSAAIELEEAKGFLGLAWTHMLRADVILLSRGLGIDGMEEAQDQTEELIRTMERYREALGNEVGAVNTDEQGR